MIYVFLGVAIASALTAILFGARVLLFAFSTKVTFNSMWTLVRYVITASVLAAFTVWLLSLALPRLFA